MNPNDENCLQLDRVVGVAPRRTPPEAWLVVQHHFGDVLREFGYTATADVLAALRQLNRQVHLLLLVRSLLQVRLTGPKFCVVLSFDYAASEESDRLDLPLVVEPQPSGDLRLVFLVRREPVVEVLCGEFAASPLMKPLAIEVEFAEDELVVN